MKLLKIKPSKYFILVFVILILPTKESLAAEKILDTNAPNAEQRRSYWSSEVKKENFVCEKLNLKECVNLGYNYTLLPNMFGHERQREADIMLNGFQLLLEYKCSKIFNLFLCLTLAPTCDPEGRFMKPIGPCQKICHKVESECRKVVESFHLPWPEWFNCSQFPEKNILGKSLCIDWMNEEDTEATPEPTDSADQIKKCKPSQHFIRTSNSCAWTCESGRGRFSLEEKTFADKWLAGWAIICFLCTSFAVGTFLLDQSRFKYPERPVIFIALCYLIMSVAVFLRLIIGREQISCEIIEDGHKILIQDGLRNTGCIIVFILSSFFNTANFVWWVVLTCSWFFAAGLKWTQEAIEEKSSYFHSLAWGIPSVQTVLILANRYVDGDELTGMCCAGSQNAEVLAKFMLAPLCTLLFSGFMIVLLGFISLFRVKSYMQREGSSTVKLEKLMFKIIIFAAFYVVTTGVVLGCYGYEISHKREISNKIELHGTSTITWNFYLRFAMQMITGLVAGGWVLSFKTMDSWRRCLQMVMIIIPDSDIEDEKGTESDSFAQQPFPESRRTNRVNTTFRENQNISEQLFQQNLVATQDNCSETLPSGSTKCDHQYQTSSTPIEQLYRPLLLTSDTSNRTEITNNP